MVEKSLKEIILESRDGKTRSELIEEAQTKALKYDFPKGTYDRRIVDIQELNEQTDRRGVPYPWGLEFADDIGFKQKIKED